MRIAICIPAHGDTKALFTLSLAGMVARAAAELPHEIKTVLGQGVLPDIRNSLAESALEWGAEAILWLDADQTFPDDTLHRLLAHGVDLVGCNYPRRRPAGAPTAALNGAVVQTNPAIAAATPLQRVDSIGLGVCLMRTSLLGRVPRPWFTFRARAAAAHVSEDVGFCQAAGGACLDHALSLEVGHVSEAVLSFGGQG